MDVLCVWLSSLGFWLAFLLSRPYFKVSVSVAVFLSTDTSLQLSESLWATLWGPSRLRPALRPDAAKVLVEERSSVGAGSLSFCGCSVGSVAILWFVGGFPTLPGPSSESESEFLWRGSGDGSLLGK